MTQDQLISGCINNDRHCQRALVNRYSGVLYTVCRRYFGDQPQAKDALQEGLVRILNAMNSFDPAKGDLLNWMRKIVANECIRLIRKEKIQFNELKDYESLSWEGNILEELHEEDLIQIINKLPFGYREVFNLFVLDGYSHKEIAELLDIKESTSRSQLTRAKKLLQREIKIIERTELCRTKD